MCRTACYKLSNHFLASMISYPDLHFLLSHLPWLLEILANIVYHKVITMMPPYTRKADFNLQNTFTRLWGALGNDSVLSEFSLAQPNARHTGRTQLACLRWMVKVLSHQEGTSTPLFCPALCLLHLVTASPFLGELRFPIHCVFFPLPLPQMVT